VRETGWQVELPRAQRDAMAPHREPTRLLWGLPAQRRQGQAWTQREQPEPVLLAMGPSAWPERQGQRVLLRHQGMLRAL
jgi:hypothetical protein